MRTSDGCGARVWLLPLCLLLGACRGDGPFKTADPPDLPAAGEEVPPAPPAATEEAPTDSPTAAGVELSVEVWGGCVYAGRGGAVVLVLHNRNRAKEIGFLAPLRPYWRTTSPEVIQREEERSVISVMLSPTILGPGETYRQGMFLSPDLRFPRPGTFVVECRVPLEIVSGPEGTLLDDEIPIPSGAPTRWLTRTVEITARELPQEQRDRSVAAFREDLRSEDPRVVLEALEDTFSMAATEPDLVPDVARLCRSEDVDIRFAACRVLEEYDSERVRETMRVLARDEDGDLAVRALRWLGPRKVILTSEECDGVVAGDDPRTLFGLMEYLDEVDHPSRKRLLEGMSRNTSPRVSERAREALGER